MKPTRVLLTATVVQDDLYPRHEVSMVNVAQLRAKREAGITLDPIIVGRLPRMDQADPSIVVDGAHRRVVHEQVGDTWIMAEVREYESEADLLADAAKFNSNHGTNLTSFDRLKVVAISERLGITPERQAEMLAMSVPQLQALTPRYAAMADPDSGVPVRVPLKASVRHLAGRQVSPTQAAAINGSAPGVSYLLIVRQLIQGLENDLLPGSDTHTVLWAELARLKTLLP